MALYVVKNQWGGSNKPWHYAGTFNLGCRSDQRVSNINITSEDEGKTFSGTMVYEGEGPIGVKATQIAGSNYKVDNQWGGEEAEWNPGGNWIIGSRTGQNVVQLAVDFTNGSLTGTMTYVGEGPIAFEGAPETGTSYTVENQWGGDNASWNMAGTMQLGTRAGQNPVEFDIKSEDGKVFTGTMTYDGEGPIGFKATLTKGNNYDVENQWGGDEAPWNETGTMVIGTRDGQYATALNITSADKGATFTGTMNYTGEGPIGFKGAVSACVNSL
jgi:hypothetical protein